MKRTLLLCILFLSISFANAQETLFVMKNGVKTAQYDIATQVDSIIFYPPTNQPPAGILKISLLGDSITHGAPNQTGYYRKWLHYLLRDAGFNFDFVGHRTDWGLPTGDDPDKDWDRDHSAQWGISTGSSADGLKTWINQFEAPDIALIHLGTNDFYNNSTVINAYKSIINTYRSKNPNVVIFLAQIIKSTHGGLEPTTKTLRPLVWALETEMSTEQSPLIVVDMWTPSSTADLTDGLHPTVLGAQKMANWWFEAIKKHYGIN